MDPAGVSREYPISQLPQPLFPLRRINNLQGDRYTKGTGKRVLMGATAGGKTGI